MPAGSVIVENFTSQVLKINPLGDPHVRRVPIYLPPGYEDGVTRFPTVYVLTGFTGRGTMLLNDSPWDENIAQRMDRLIASGVVRPMILVMPDCFTRMGGSQYINSSFIHYLRAIKKFGGLDTFWNEFPTIRPKDRDFSATLNTIAMAACYCPNPNAPHGFDLPFDAETGEMCADVWKRMLEWDPVYLVEKYADVLRSLRLLYLDAGLRDEFNLQFGARIFCQRLKERGINYVYEEFDDGHMNVAYRYDNSLKAISEAIANLKIKTH